MPADSVDAMFAIGPQFFYTVPLAVTLWFLDKGKSRTGRAGNILFVDARSIYQQIDRAHRTFTPEQGEFLANIVRLYRGEEPEFYEGSEGMLAEHFPRCLYRDVAGLCRMVPIDEMASQGWSLNAGRYVGVTDVPVSDSDFLGSFEELVEKFEVLSSEAQELEQQVAEDANRLLGLAR